MKKLLLLIFIFINQITFAQTQHDIDSINISNGYLCLYYDFGGYYLPANTQWVQTYGPINATASAINGNVGAMDTVVRMGKEYWSPFNVVVTTDSTTFLAAPIGRRTRVIFTSNCTWYGCGTSGTSYIGSMGWGGVDNPAFVFDIAGGNNKKGSVAVHEAAHTIALSHQGIYPSTTYNPGYGTGDTSFAPLMGVPYVPNLQVWWNGYSVILGRNQYDIEELGTAYEFGTTVGFTTPDYGTTMSAAKNISKNQSVYSMVSAYDSNYFKFTLPSIQNVTFSVVPWSLGNNYKAMFYPQIDICDVNGNVIGSSVKTATITISYSIRLNTGTYYIKLRSSRLAYYNPTGYGFMGHSTLSYTY